MKIRSLIFLSVLAGILASPSAEAARDNFQQLDTNQDGLLSQNEWLNGARAEHQALDTNRDGIVHPDEFYSAQGGTQDNRYRNKRRAARFEDMDVNRDGLLHPSEWPANAADYYAALDANGDGLVSYNEFFNRKEISTTVLNGLDTNNDNRISRGEWTGEAAEFNGADTNHDNFLTVAEISAASTASSTQTSTSANGGSIEDILLRLFQNQ